MEKSGYDGGTMATLCRNCGGKLVYSPSKQRMTCAMCGATFRPEDVSAADKEHLQSVDTMTQAELFGTRDKASYDCHIYTCSHCGGEIAINGTEVSTFCVYCGNPTVVFKRVSKEMRPDGIVPFSITEEEARKLIGFHLKKGHFIPSQIRNRKIEGVRGIYIPYWIVNCDFHDAVLFKGSIKSGKSSRTTHFGRSGTCSFEHLPVDASLRLNDNISKKLEPYFYDDVKDFDEDYLSGFYSDTTDMSPSDLRAAILKRCDEMFCQEVMRTVKAKDVKVEKSSPSVNIHNDAIYLMLPAWFYTFTYKDKPITILVNGQTGKTVGTVPFNKVKVGILSAALFLLMSAAVLSPVFLLNPVELLLIVQYMAMISVSLSTFLTTIAVAKIKRFRSNMIDTQSSSTFLYAKKRQV